MKFRVLLILATMIIFLWGCAGEPKENLASVPEQSGEAKAPAPSVVNADYTAYFQGVEGTAVFLNSRENTYYIYNQDLAEKPSSPCSSFKIISCLMGLESGAIDPANSTLEWNGTNFPVDEWNKDIDYQQAFESSCIWYFRRVIDTIGGAYVQDTMNRLNYGNRDITEWQGSLNNLIFPDMKDYKELNGFWQESSLQISPTQQVDVLKRIFEDRGVFSDQSLALIKDVMLVENTEDTLRIYGKTGSGKKDANWSDAWFVGLFEKDGETTYFAVRLNQPDTYGAKAKEIALDIINHEFGGETASAN